MCHGRLAAGEAPACVQACPNEAIRIEVVKKTSIVAHGEIVPGAFESSYTKPSTTYRTSRDIPASAVAVDTSVLRLEHAHWPLIGMLVLSQIAAGLHVSQFIAGGRALAIAAFVALNAGLALSVAHLGRPLKAWRAFLGWRKSWMSREILCFSAYAGSAALLILFPDVRVVAFSTSALAVLSVFCSAMIYVDTRRPAWTMSRTGMRFFGTLTLMGAAAGGCILGWLGSPLAPRFVIAATIIRTALFLAETLRRIKASRFAELPDHRAAVTESTLLRPVIRARLLLFLASTVFSILAIFTGAPVWGAIALLTTTAGCVLERYSFFTACAAPRMPGL
jgi:DMSO reductase anchor subunit